MAPSDTSICPCGCGKKNTLRTQKEHLTAAHISAPTSRPKTNRKAKIRALFRRISSSASIRTYLSRQKNSKPAKDSSANAPTSPALPPCTLDNTPDDTPPDQPMAEALPNFCDDAMELDDLDLPPTEPNFWDSLLDTRANTIREHSPDTSRSSSDSEPGATSSSISEAGSEFSIETLSDRYFGLHLSASTRGLDSDTLMRAEELVDAALNAPEMLEQEDIDKIATYDMYVRCQPTEALYSEIRERYRPKGSKTDLPSLKALRSDMHKLSGLSPKYYDSCIKSCIAYTKINSKLTECPTCGSPRLDPATGKPMNQFTYIPLIPQLRARNLNPDLAQKLKYRHEYKHQDNTISDILDGDHYQNLCKQNVVVDGEEMPYKYFQDKHEVALGLSADGMCPFKKRKHTCWPLLLVDYTLPPDERTHIDNLICVGVIPGPKAPADINSYLEPLIEELVELARGVPAVDILERKLISLRAHLLAVFGDIPALSKILEFLGHNATIPCRFCFINTVAGVTSSGGTHRYCPLHQPDGTLNDPLNLPIRTHDECLRLGLEALRAPSDNARKVLATKSGIKGVTLLARLNSISVPASFPIDVMHMVWLNLIPQLVDLWTGQFNELNDGLENYRIKKTVWAAIGTACGESGRTMPSAFGCKVPSFDKRSHFIAETWSNFTLFLAPSLLRRRFKDIRFYNHFVRLVKLLRLVMSFDIPRSELPNIRRGFAEWIEEYEQIYYQFDADRLQTCPVNVHYLLHVADCVQFLGPPWCYWSYLMERFCSYVGNCVKSRRYPYANIDQRLLNQARLRIILLKYHLYGKKPFIRKKKTSQLEASTVFPKYPHYMLLTPNSKRLPVTPLLRLQIIRHLTTSFKIKSRRAKQLIPDELEQWGRVQNAGGGDLLHARGYHQLRADERDASFVRYVLLVDLDADFPELPERLAPRTQYGQLRHVFALRIPPRTKKVNRSRKERVLLLALIHEATFHVDNEAEHEVIWYKQKLGSGEVVDMSTVQCVVGRIPDGKRWWIVDRSLDNPYTYPEFT